MRRRRNGLAGILAGGLIVYGVGTLTGVIGWPGEGRGLKPAATFIISGPCSSLSAAANPSSSNSGATTVAVTARAGGCSNPLYEFWVLAPDAPGYQVVQPYSNRSTFTWSPIEAAPGTYRFGVWARDAASDGLSVNSLGRMDVLASAGTFTVTTCSAVGITVTGSSVTRAGATIHMRAQTSGCGHPLYRFWVLLPGAAAYQMVRDYSPSPTLTWTTTGPPAGIYRIGVWARDRASLGVDGDSRGRWDTLGGTAYRIA